MRVIIRVQDNGIGLPPHLDWEQSQSLGLRIVKTLVRQLKGELKVGSENGTCFAVTFAGVEKT